MLLKNKEEKKNSMSSEDPVKPSWKNRRKAIQGTLLFCAFCIAYIMFQGNDTRINESIIFGCFGLAGSVLGVYIGGAAWENINVEKLKSTAAQSQNRNTNPIITPSKPDNEKG